MVNGIGSLIVLRTVLPLTRTLGRGRRRGRASIGIAGRRSRTGTTRLRSKVQKRREALRRKRQEVGALF